MIIFHLRCTIFFVFSFLTIYGACASELDYATFYQKWQRTAPTDLCSRGEKYMADNKLDSATAFFTLARTLNTELNDSVQMDVFVRTENCTGIIAFMQGDYMKAYTSFRRVLDTENAPRLAAMVNMGGLYHYFGDKARSSSLLYDILREAIREKDANIASTAISNLMSFYFTDTDSVDTEKYTPLLKEFIGKFSDSEDRRIPFGRSCALAMIAASDKDWIGAVNYLRASLPLASDMLVPNHNYIASRLALGSCFMHLNEPDSAALNFSEAEALALANNYPELLIEACALQASTLQASGDNFHGGIYKYRYYQMKDSLFNITEFGKLRDIEANYDMQIFEDRLTEMAVERRFHMRILLIGGAALVIIALMLAIVFKKNRELKNKNRDLYDRTIELLRNADSQQSTNFSSSAEDVGEKYTSSSLSDDNKALLADRISDVLNDDRQICDASFSLETLASLCDSNTKYVSQTINEIYGKNFSRVLNERRIRLVCRRLLDNEHFGNLTMEAISMDTGFKSRSNFSKTFKAVIGMTPTEFLKESKERAQ